MALMMLLQLHQVPRQAYHLTPPPRLMIPAFHLLLPRLKKKSLGRPKGSTDAAARSLEEQVKQATEEAAKMLKQSQLKLKSAKKRLRKGSLDDIISAAKKKHCVPDDVVICSETVRQRVKRNGKQGGSIGQQ